MTVKVHCSECGIAYQVKPYRVAKTRFCSFQCAGTMRARETLNVGTKTYMIGNKFRVGKRPANAFAAGITGSDSPRWKDGACLTCQNCAKPFKQKPWLERQNGVARFCSRTCFQTSGIFDGEKSPHYVGGKTTYRGKGWIEARFAVVTEQCGNCATCDKHVGPSLPVHHIIPYRRFQTAADANRRENLVGLCQSCHMKEETRG